MSITETFYPVLVEILVEDHSAFNRLDLGCGMCMEKMTFDSEDEICEPDNEAGLHSHAYILPCGHMFCFSCCAKLMVLNRDSERLHKCPTCRYDLHHSYCKCPHNMGALFHPKLNGEKFEAMEARMREAYNLRCICLRCHMEAFLRALRVIATYRFDYLQLLRDRQFLAVTVKYGTTRWETADTQGLRPIKTLPTSPELLQLFEMVANGLIEMHGLDPFFEFELHLYEDRTDDRTQSDYLTQQGLKTYVQTRVLTTRVQGQELAHYLALTLADAWLSDESFLAYVEELRVRDSVFLEMMLEDTQDSESSELEEGEGGESESD
ncbi:hypothetical protein F53441_10389 [Fusarium austroafricanum]|uniref:RING-type domain-containing protein n=1 Tax=Fusarium austroafricanum TaxID=2364996 RepID=A0A8H4KAU3_9HYPO|nr:hypothetical protein F53441_10389 [Fusarium austroafricanum]